MSPDRARLTIDLDALAHNRTVIAAAVGGAEVAAVVKADGYGLGVGPVARRLHTEGTTSFFVARSTLISCCRVTAPGHLLRRLCY